MQAENTEWNERLETVWEDSGLSRKDFWRKVVGEREDETYEWSEHPQGKEPKYAARSAIRYHRTDSEGRMPPVDYLKRVSEVFDIRIQWLVTGHGPKRRTPTEMRWISHPLRRRMKEESEWFASHSMGIQWAFLDLLNLYQMQIGPRRIVELGTLDTDVRHADDLEFLLRLPLIAWGYDPAFHTEIPRSYWRHLIGALYDAVWAQHRGDTPGADPVPRSEPFVRQFRNAYFDTEGTSG